jgi:hypothetical protein
MQAHLLGLPQGLLTADVQSAVSHAHRQKAPEIEAVAQSPMLAHDCGECIVNHVLSGRPIRRESRGEQEQTIPEGGIGRLNLGAFFAAYWGRVHSESLFGCVRRCDRERMRMSAHL